MATAAIALPLLGLRIMAGPIELRDVTDDLIVPLAELASAGIHDQGFMPFSAPWSADLAVFYDGELAGSQGINTRDFLVTRTGETGSWLSRRYQGRGIGTAMRQVMCAFVFDCLDAAQVTSAAFADNPASLAVSRKCGYTENGCEVKVRMGKRAILQHIVLRPADLVRYDHQLTIEGLAEFRRSIGLDQPDNDS